MKKITLIFLTLSILSSCATHEEKIQKNFTTAWSDYFEKDFSQTSAFDVFVVTNRKAKNNTFTCSDDQFGAKINQDLQFGICQVSVPKNHAVGEIELAKDDRQSAQNYFKILGAKPLLESDLIESIKKSKRTPLIFVHGFNVRYQEAVLRAAQIGYDLKYQGLIILFTWPAGAGDSFFDDKILNKTYADNALTANASVATFQNFLLDLQKNNIKPNLAVHSMGHQIVLPALKNLSETNPKKTFISKLILNAPDFPVSDFRSFAQNIEKVSDHITLYCSQNDKAMIASKAFNKNDRLGACAMINDNDIDVINVGLIDDSALGLGHGYYSSRAILGDVFQNLLGVSADKRLFVVKSDPNSPQKYSLRK